MITLETVCTVLLRLTVEMESYVVGEISTVEDRGWGDRGNGTYTVTRSYVQFTH